MKREDEIKKQAYMMLCELAFLFSKQDGVRKIHVFNMKNIRQTAEFNIVSNRIILSNSTMSETNTYKAMLIAERNKEFLFKGFKKWESTQKSA